MDRVAPVRTLVLMPNPAWDPTVAPILIPSFLAAVVTVIPLPPPSGGTVLVDPRHYAMHAGLDTRKKREEQALLLQQPPQPPLLTAVKWSRLGRRTTITIRGTIQIPKAMGSYVSWITTPMMTWTHSLLGDSTLQTEQALFTTLQDKRNHWTT
ncbi:hypothetical protein PIB30_046996 [Stylosanthes scabra]|uniref:Uncharacterized protein n=1 Tax=Stylosanthes scabra TaxID=79078 RepID=A0ABU6XGV2_9FABA|nr:hypothetical protein [Stylosanthes scabra]